MNNIEHFLKGGQITLVDCGAKGEVYQLNQLGAHIQAHGFEPNPAEFAKLVSAQADRRRNITYYPTAIAETNQPRTFHITRHPSYCSFLEPDLVNFEKHFRHVPGFRRWLNMMDVVSSIQVQCASLSEFCHERGISNIDFLKLDTQGAELSILKGANTLLERKAIGVIYIEVGFIAVYKNQPLFGDVHRFLIKAGYEFVDCRFYPEILNRQPDRADRRHAGFPLFDQPRYAASGDAVYVPNIDLIKVRKEKNELLKIGMVMGSLGYISFARSFMEASGLATSETRVLLKSLVQKPGLERIKKLARDWMPPKLLSAIQRLKASL